jgi:hypothetical protein
MHTLEWIRLFGAIACLAGATVGVRNHLSRREQRRSMDSPRPSLAEAFPEVNHRYGAVDTAPQDTDTVNLEKPSTEAPPG